MIRMRDKNQTYIQFRKSVSHRLEVLLDPNEIGILRNHVVDSPTFRDGNFTIKFLWKNLRALKGLALISYYVPENLGWYIRLELLEYSRKLDLENQLQLKLLLDSKDSSLTYFYDSKEISSHDFFGNILREGAKCLKTLKIIPPNKKVKKPKRKRGYHDHGSRTPDHKWIEKNLGDEWTIIQNEIEVEKNLYRLIYLLFKTLLREKSELYKKGN